ncbi:MAG TPA: SLBB domain-containing protein [Gemmatimonadales bacterium]|nr:SLBB domain-containing protein [Gemmatimonadales bacterium]
MRIALLLLCAIAPEIAAQQPTPAQVQEALQNQPGLADQVRSRIAQSGLTPDQIRARLTASGYPSTLLDPYLSTNAGVGPNAAPTAQELAALQALGLPTPAESLLRPDTGVIRVSAKAPSDVFGVDVFRRTTTQFLPLLSGPVPPDYRLGPGDNLVLILTGDVELTYSLPVTREGFILIPQVGQVHVANLTLEQLRDVLYTRLGRVYSGVRRGANATTRFDVTVANVRANQIYVVGEVAQPGAYQISSLGTVFTALYAAGGVTDLARLRDVEVQRGGRTIASLDLYDYLLRGDTRSDIRLETGDVIFVPVHGSRVRLTGAVVRPAVYETKPDETLYDVVKAAGGFLPMAALERVKVERVLPGAERSTQTTAHVTIDVQLANGLVPPFRLEDGDIVHVDSLRDAAEQYMVAINGMVQQPGSYPWHPGMTLRELMTLARGPKVGVDLREAEIARLPADRSKGQLATTLRVPLDSTYLFERDSTGRYLGPPGLTFPVHGTAQEVQLEAYDNVLVFRQPNFELQRMVTITGEVMYPGEYALRSKDERLADIIDRAGGLSPRAYTEGIRFVRPLENRGRINIDLDHALKDKGSRDNIIMQPGDSVRIPEYQPSVRVTGAVNSPGSVLYQKGASLDYYLSAGGGFTRLAEKGQVSVRYANGEVKTRRKGLLFSSDPKPGPGSEVYVPPKDLTVPHTDYVALFGAIAQILASTVAIIVVAKQ